ncbi:MAG: UDP-N-acetylglucosamine--N-acetylmuramyl-(pentapeptide) pyrophosphoryl-undecaprenol N-acetylglucosamine transferase [Tissierellia bacterium]|nr:UDP-N-acetylglucosamine--N-acetylmuramyl-(pentapeptide) pyrophosphoryl-undecaprenol N-acetylglucosamine transferase [Tissierellia bacterium]
MKYVLTGGGTAGHIYPALAVAEKLKSIDSDSQIFYMGLSNHLEEKLAAKEGYPFLPIVSMPLTLRPSKQTFQSIRTFFKGVKMAKKHFKEIQPDAVLATGGYVSGPVGYAAHLMKIPLYIHESNAHPGVTSRFLDRYSQITFYSYKDCLSKLKGRGEKIFSGTPIRSGFHNQKEAPMDLVLSFGGSGGQKSLNEAILTIFNNTKHLPFPWIHIYGLNWEKEFHEGLKQKPEEAEIHSYYHDLFDLMGKASLVICGPGAQTLSELAASRKASILIPKSYVKENHQYYNAKAFADGGAARMVTEDELTADTLMNMVQNLMDSPAERQAMEQAAAAFHTPGSARKIAETIISHLESRV